MDDLKWADVAHYYKYVEHEVLVSHSGNREPLRRISKHGEDLSIYYRKRELVEAGFVAIPILQHREDMTEAQAREICEPMIESLKEIEGDSFELPKSFKAFLFRDITHKGTWSLFDHAIGNPRDWHKFLKLGIDIFGLIERGEAIRKEVSND